ncbi:MAG: ribonuclease H-like domain-containing protein, partial [Magnetococcales bacterium]|nr:ribonuclease H-like domain-containing protein [Magnetococcales bacterium]
MARGLKQRLGALRQQAGAVPAATPHPAKRHAPQPSQHTDPPESPPLQHQKISNKPAQLGQTLRRLLRSSHSHLSYGDLSAPPLSQGRGRPVPIDETKLAKLLGGERLGDGLFRIDRNYPLGFRIGSAPLVPFSRHASYIPPEINAQQTTAPALYLDTETSGLAGGVGTVAFQVGLGRFESDTFRVTIFLITTFAAETAMLKAVRRWCAECGLVVSYNGRAFDMPLLSARYRLAELENPLEYLPHLDLLSPTRTAFRNRWPDCRLGTAERWLLRFRRKDDLPGAQVPEVWRKLLQWGDTSQIRRVVKHNALDILGLAALAPMLDQVFQNPTTFDAHCARMARSFKNRGQEALGWQLLTKTPKALDHDGQLELARWQIRAERWSKAVAIWEMLLEEEGCAESCERLAKFHEHRSKQLQQALAYTRRLMLM